MSRYPYHVWGDDRGRGGRVLDQFQAPPTGRIETVRPSLPNPEEIPIARWNNLRSNPAGTAYPDTQNPLDQLPGGFTHHYVVGHLARPIVLSPAAAVTIPTYVRRPTLVVLWEFSEASFSVSYSSGDLNDDTASVVSLVAIADYDPATVTYTSGVPKLTENYLTLQAAETSLPIPLAGASGNVTITATASNGAANPTMSAIAVYSPEPDPATVSPVYGVALRLSKTSSIVNPAGLNISSCRVLLYR